MAVSTAGISTLGIKVGYAVGAADTKPSAFTWLERCNSVGGITLDTEKIDASALEDSVSRYIAGRADTGGDWSLQFNISSEVQAQLAAMISAYKAIMSDDSQVMWFTVWSPFMTDAYFIIAQPPLQIPMPEMGQNELEVVEMTLAVSEYKGLMAGVEPTAA